MKRPLAWILTLVSIVVITVPLACTGDAPKFRYETDASIKELINATPAVYPTTRLLVFSDPHIFPSEMGTSGAAFEDYVSNDRKLLRESTRLMDSLVKGIAAEKADFVLVSGDLTKDGERKSHELFAAYLRGIEATGKPVYIVPGNHDILNPHAQTYAGNTATPVPTVSPQEFAEIYDAFGYRESLARDSDSLSYIAEPVNGLWLFALDSCLYRNNKEESVTDGAFSPATMAWIESHLIEAMQKSKAVIVMMHHGVVEHYQGQEKNFGDYIVNDYETVAKLFAAYNARLVFTGHYHAQDITQKQTGKNGKSIYDIETGSLVTYPNPFRIVTINSRQQVDITSRYVTAIEGFPTGFAEYARSYVEDGVIGIAVETLGGYGIKAGQAEILAKQVGAAFVAHYAGDERLSPGQVAITSKGTGILGKVVFLMKRGLIQGLWRDLPPADNNVLLNLNAR